MFNLLGVNKILSLLHAFAVLAAFDDKLLDGVGLLLELLNFETLLPVSILFVDDCFLDVFNLVFERR